MPSIGTLHGFNDQGQAHCQDRHQDDPDADMHPFLVHEFDCSTPVLPPAVVRARAGQIQRMLNGETGKYQLVIGNDHAWYE